LHSTQGGCPLWTMLKQDFAYKWGSLHTRVSFIGKINIYPLCYSLFIGWGTPIGISVLIVSIGLFIFLVSFASKFLKKDKDK